MTSPLKEALIAAAALALSTAPALATTTVTTQLISTNDSIANGATSGTFDVSGFQVVDNGDTYNQAGGYFAATAAGDTLVITKIGGGTFTLDNGQISIANGASLTYGYLNGVQQFNGLGDNFSSTPAFATTVGAAAYNLTSLVVSADTDALRVYGVSVDSAAAPAVPEPATWAMMLAGFALVGAAMRRTNSKMPAARQTKAPAVAYG